MSCSARRLLVLAWFVALPLTLHVGAGSASADSESPPNVVLVITDDQGYGDVGAHGNKMIKTPNLDRLWAESVRLTDYHVDPTCSPTRSALMSGRYSTRTGVWHTILGRSLMRPEELTVAEVFKANGYKTGMFGKWHLGDNYPCRPQDQGFETAVYHGGGGVGQGPDYWGNDYFDDTYWRNGKPEKFTGYCTDVWFDEATKFIEKCGKQKESFFCYLTTNAPHGPYLVDEKYSQPYADEGVPKPMDDFYGMITNIDENVGKLRAKLDDLGLAENTIFIFTTDNGTAAGVKRGGKNSDKWTGFNAGMKGQKGSEYDGGHRVPLFVHWPGAGLTEGRDMDYLCAHVDVLPTLVDLCNLDKPEGPPLAGVSLRDEIMKSRKVLPSRTLFVHSQRIQVPQKWRKCAVMTQRWRLVNGKELYDMNSDPGQTKNVAGDHPELVSELRAAYDGWWESLRPRFDEYVRIHLGNEADNPTRLMSHDWHADGAQCPWHQGHVQRRAIDNGPWSVFVEEDGEYEIKLLRWPDHLERPMQSTHARLKLGDVEAEQDVDPESTEATFTVKLSRGPAMFETWLTTPDGKTHGAYYAKVKRK